MRLRSASTRYMPKATGQRAALMGAPTPDAFSVGVDPCCSAFWWGRGYLATRRSMGYPPLTRGVSTGVVSIFRDRPHRHQRDESLFAVRCHDHGGQEPVYALAARSWQSRRDRPIALFVVAISRPGQRGDLPGQLRNSGGLLCVLIPWTDVN